MAWTFIISHEFSAQIFTVRNNSEEFHQVVTISFFNSIDIKPLTMQHFIIVQQMIHFLKKSVLFILLNHNNKTYKHSYFKCYVTPSDVLNLWTMQTFCTGGTISKSGWELSELSLYIYNAIPMTWWYKFIHSSDIELMIHRYDHNNKTDNIDNNYQILNHRHIFIILYIIFDYI